AGTYDYNRDRRVSRKKWIAPVNGQAVQPPREGDGEVLVRGGSRGDPPAPCRLLERDRADGNVLARAGSEGDWAALLPPRRVVPRITIPVVRPLAARPASLRVTHSAAQDQGS